MALLEADVDFAVAKQFIATVREKSLGEEVLKGVKPGEQIIKIFHDELTALLGGDAEALDLTAPARILIVGLNGAGKTTTSAKLALKLKKEGRRPVLVACDLYRPAAIEQLATLAREIDVPVFKPQPGDKNVLKCVKESLKWLDTQNWNVLVARLRLENGHVNFPRQRRQLFDGRRPVKVAGHQHRTAAFLLQFERELGGSGGLPRAVEADDENARGGREVERFRIAAEQGGEFVVEDFDDLLARLHALEDFLAE